MRQHWRSHLFLLVIMALVAGSLAGQPMVLDPDFAPVVQQSSSVTQWIRFVPAADRQMIVLGSYDPPLTHVNEVPVSHALGWILADGTPNPNFKARLPEQNEVVTDAVALPDGRILAATSSPARIVRLLANGVIDPTFSPLALSGDGYGKLTASGDGSVIVWGSFTGIGDFTRNGLARIRGDGTVDPDFSPSITDGRLTVVSLVATADSGVLFSAQGYKQDQPLSIHFNRLTRTGAIDTSFAPPPPGQTFLILGVLSDSRMLIQRDGLQRLKADGTIDPTYSPQFDRPENIERAILLPAGRLAVQATTLSPARVWVSSVFVLKPDGTTELDCRELPGAERIQSLCGVRSDGAVVIAQGPLVWVPTRSSSVLAPGMHEPMLGVIDSTAHTLTRLPTRFECRSTGGIQRLSPDPTGGILVEGSFARIAGVPRSGLARFKLDGSLDLSFDPVAVSPVFHLPGGDAIATRTTLGPPDANGFHSYIKQMVRLRKDGSLDPTFAPAENLDLLNAVWLTTDRDGRILVSVFENGIPGSNNVRLVWLTPTGGLSAQLSTTFSGNYYFQPSAVQFAAALPNGKLLVRPDAYTVNGERPTILVRLNIDGSTDTTYHPSSTFDQLQSFSYAKPLPDGSGYVYGPSSGTGSSQPLALRLNPDGSPDALVPIALADGIPLSDGSVIYQNKRYRADGSEDLNFDIQIGEYNHVRSAVLTPGSVVWLGGGFRVVQGEPRPGIARLVPKEIAGFTHQPESLSTLAGHEVTFQAEIGTAAPAVFQWTHDGTPIPGATGRWLTLPDPRRADAGEYRLIATVGDQTYTSGPATLTIEPSAARLINLSARSGVSPQYPPQIGGFVVSGTTPRTVLLRAVGRGLPLDNPTFTLLPQPSLSLFHEGRVIAANAGGALASAIIEVANRVGAAPLRSVYPPDQATRDSALLLTLDPGVYSAHTASIDGQTGVSLFEFYDTHPATDAAAVVNASIRGRAAPGDDVLIAGFVIGGTGTLRMLIRGLGPELARRSVTGALSDPQLTLFSGASALRLNDNWSEHADAPHLVMAAAQVGAPALATGSRDAALLVDLGPGIYTVHGSAADGATGDMLIELFVVE